MNMQVAACVEVAACVGGSALENAQVLPPTTCPVPKCFILLSAAAAAAAVASQAQTMLMTCNATKM